MLRVRPDIEATTVPHAPIREQEVLRKKEQTEKQEKYKQIKKEFKENVDELKRTLENLTSATYDYPSHIWVAFQGSQAMAKLKKIQDELESEGYITASQFIGAPVVKNERRNWANDLKRHIMSKLVDAFKDEEGYTADVLSNMYDLVSHIWHAAFTSSSFNPNEGQNYESWEKIGDSAAKLGLQEEMMTARPDISEHELTVAVNTILAKQEQSRVSIALGFPQFLLTIYPDINVSETEDLFESFFGALYEMGQTENVGQPMVTHFIWYLNKIGLINLSGEIYDTPPKTQISILFSTFGWGHPIEQKRREGDLWRTRILVEDNMKKVAMKRKYYVLDIEDAKEKVDRGIPYKNIPEQYITTLMAGGEVGNAVGDNEEKSVYNAYKDAVRRLREMGIIKNYGLEEHYRANQEFDPVYEEQYTKAYKRAKAMGYTNIFSTDSKIRYDRNKTNAYISLLGIRRLSNGEMRKEPIYLLTIPNTAKNASLLSEVSKEELRGMTADQKSYTRELAKGKRKELRRILYEAFAEDKHLARPTQERNFTVEEGEDRDEEEEEEDENRDEEEGEEE